MDKETTKVSCVASSIRHTAPIGSVAISQTSSKFFASVSQDSCLKLWNLSENTEHKGKRNFYLNYTLFIAHHINHY